MNIDKTANIVSECACALGEPCSSYAAGHSMHFLQQRLASATPSKWRDGIVERIEADGWTAVRLLETDERVWLWNHADLTSALQPAEPVTLHVGYDVLAHGDARFNVAVLQDRASAGPTR
jgi:hypothetical protein